MKLGFHYHIPAIQKANGEIYLPGYLGVFIDGLAKEVEDIVLFMHSPLKHELDQMDYLLTSKNISLRSVGPHLGFFKRILNRKVLLSAIENEKDNLDLMLIRGPSPLLPFIAAMCKKCDINYSFLLVGDYLKTLKGAKELGLMKKVILGMYYFLNKSFQDKSSKDALVFANNQVIYDEYRLIQSHTYLMRTTTLNTDDFFYRNDTCLNDTIELIYAGRIESTKGIDDILQAMKELEGSEKKIILNLVGWDASADNSYLKYLHITAEKLGLSDQFIFHGKKRVGDELLSMYRKSDIFIIATKGNEGFPRTIWEAMASSMPVIATKVGSIPVVLQDNKDACLINEGAPKEIASRIKELIAFPQLRKELIANGLELAKDNTNEIQAQKMLRVMKNYLQDDKNV